ncbi:hypothetical protein [Nocardiopsis sp. JB363]|uniref:hypothetical protein n=1 Tax=Nocardiopsis sp. JB363 TaxID=1434837 RepID=UPI000B34AA10|nr:hypothetical protein [Nocardiopsis sp. JB363]
MQQDGHGAGGSARRRTRRGGRMRNEGPGLGPEQRPEAETMPAERLREAKRVPSPREEQPARASTTDDPDVYLDIPVVKVDEIELDVEDLAASVSLEADVLDLLRLKVGVDVELGHVGLTIKGVEAQALLKVQLDNVREIIARVLKTIDSNPQIIEHITRGVGRSLDEVSGGAGEAVSEAGRGAGDAVAGVGRGAGEAVAGAGRGAGRALAETADAVGDTVGALDEEDDG